MSEIKGKRDRSPAFPAIPLGDAVDKLVAFEKKFGRHPAPYNKTGMAWGLKQAGDYVAALRYYGFVEYVGTSDSRQIAITEAGRNLLRVQQETVKERLLREAALRPKEIAKFWALWGADRPPDEVCVDELMLRNSFSERGAPLFLRTYDGTIAYAKLGQDDKIATDSAEAGTAGASELAPVSNPPQLVKVGDHMQWTISGQDQFPSPKRANWVSEDGTHVRVHGSMTEIPVNETRVVNPPSVPGASKPQTNPSRLDINILLVAGGLLEITATVDDIGLVKLIDTLTKYKEILALLSDTSETVQRSGPEQPE
jgi:hypothetical protein